MRVALNGYGRIGRSFVRALLEREAGGWRAPFTLVAVNDLGRPEDLYYLSRFDSTHGPCRVPVALEQGADGPQLLLGEHRARLLSEAEPAALPWRALEAALVLECTGVFRAHDEAARHLSAGAERVIIGAVPFDHADAMLVYGINHTQLQPGQRVLSAASCTTHAIAPLLATLDEAFGVEQVLMKEVHAYTSDQSLLDHVHRDPRRGRAAAQNIVPTTSSAIGAVQQILPRLNGRVSGDSIRVPTLNVAMVDLTLRLTRTPSVPQLNELFIRRVDEVPWLIGYNAEPLVSVDFNHRSESVIFDATQTRVQGDMVRVVAWYDNEWGYANRLLDLVSWMAEQEAA